MQKARSETTASSTAPAEGEIVRHNGGWLRPWQPGRSGNPGGIGGEYCRVRALAKEHSRAAMLELISLMTKSDDERVRYMSAMAVMERGVGKPRGHSDEDAIAGRLNIAALDKDERDALGRLLQKVLGR